MPVPLNAGLGAAETARRLAGVRADLAQMVGRTAERMLEEPRLEVKATLAAHLYDDARSIAGLDRRIEELGGASEAVPTEPGELLGQIEPLLDEPTLRVLTKLLHRRRRHDDELDPRIHPPRERIPEVDLPSPAAAHVEAADHAAREMHRAADQPWDFHVDMARIAADSMRTALILEHLPEEADAALEHVAATDALHARIRARWKL